MKKLFSCLLAILMVCSIITSCSTPNNLGDNQENNQESKKTGEDYELEVWQAFWESASDFFGVEYSDYKMAQTAYSFICDNETSDGYTSHYYLIQTAFETKNVYGQKIDHKVTARCYYVPEYSNTVYTVYITCDGETVYFDEDTEDWLLGIAQKPNNTSKPNSNTQNNSDSNSQNGGNSGSQNSGNNTQNNAQNNTNNDSGNTSNTPTTNDVNKLRTLAQELCLEYNRDFAYYNSYINAIINSATSITIEHIIMDEIAPDDEGVVEWLEEGLVAFFEEALVEEGFPQKVTITIDSEYTIANSQNSNTKEKNNIDDLRYIVNGVCDNYNSGETAYNGTLSATVNSATSVTITHSIPESLLFEEQSNVDAMESVIQQLFSETLNDYFPQYITVTVKTSVAYTSYKPDFEWDNGFADEDINWDFSN